MILDKLQNEDSLIHKLQELEKENARLRMILENHGISYSVAENTTTTLQAECPLRLSLQDKVALFQSVFQGREDVFAK